MKSILLLKTSMLILVIILSGLVTENLFSQNSSTKKKTVKIIEYETDGETTIDTIFAWESDSLGNFDGFSFDSLGLSIESLFADINEKMQFDFDFEEFGNELDGSILISGKDIDDINIKHIKIDEGFIIINEDTIQTVHDSVIDLALLGLCDEGVLFLGDENDEKIKKSKIVIHDKDHNYSYSYGRSHHADGDTYYDKDYSKHPMHIKGENGIYRDVFIHEIGDSDMEYLIENNILTTNDLEIDDLHFYPNHKTSQFTIGFNLEQKNDVSFNIYNLSGKKVFTTEFNDDQIEESIDLAFYGSGTYFLQIEVNEKSLCKKIILN